MSYVLKRNGCGLHVGAVSMTALKCSHPVFMLIGSWKGRKKVRVGIFCVKTCQGHVTGNKQRFWAQDET